MGTDNSRFYEKVKLRLKAIAEIPKDDVSILECYAGKVLSAVAKIVDHVKIGKINNFRGWDKKIDWNDFLKKAVQICRAAELPFYIKADLRQFADGVELSENEKNMDFLNL